jgi:phosphatidylglycerol:prolipoprotein diacylglycerol transferase
MKILSIFFGVLGILLFIILSILPITQNNTQTVVSQVFGGNWILKQSFNLGTIPELILLPEGNLPILGLVEVRLPSANIQIRFYSLLILIGTFVGYWLILKLSRSRYISSTVMDRAILGQMVVFVIGARAMYVFTHFDKYAPDPATILTGISEGGLSFFGGLLASFGYTYLYCKRFKFSFFEFVDIFIPAFLIVQICARIGNLFNYEAYGLATSVNWKLYIPETYRIYNNLNDKFFHPTFLYEGVTLWILLVLILWFYRKLTIRRTGLIMAIYLISYGLIRIFVEGLRIDATKIKVPDFLQFCVVSCGTFDFQYLLFGQVMGFLSIVFGLIIFSNRISKHYVKHNDQEFDIKN